MPNWPRGSAREVLAEKILGDKIYFSRLRRVLGLDEILVKAQEEIPWNTKVYVVGGVKKADNKYAVRAAVAYRTPSSPPGEFDEHGDPAKRKEQTFEQHIDGELDKNTIVGILNSAIQTLRQKNDSLKG